MEPASPPRKVPPEKIEVSRGLLIALAAAALVGILGVTFLIGRESARAQPAVGPASAASPANPDPPGAGMEAGGVPSATYANPSAPALVAGEASPPFSSPLSGAVEATPPNAAAAPRDKLRDEVAGYFREVEAIQSQAKSWSDPEALAQKLLEQASKGDVSGFDGLASANQKVRDNLRGLTVPEPCREHHRRTVALLDESIAMLERVKGQMNGADVSALTAMATQGQELERNAKSVDAMAAEIKRRFGL
jgi:hypothetical protein